MTFFGELYHCMRFAEIKANVIQGGHSSSGVVVMAANRLFKYADDTFQLQFICLENHKIEVWCFV